MWKTQSGGNTESAADTSPRFRLSIQMRWYSITDSTGMLDLNAGVNGGRVDDCGYQRPCHPMRVG
jgi:hypothetical protein